MADYRLSKVQRNQIYALATKVGLDTGSIEWQDEPSAYSDLIHVILHRSSGSFFKAPHSNRTDGTGYFTVESWPRITDRIDSGRVPDDDWEGLRICIDEWLTAVKEEVDAPDLWQIARDQRAWLTSSQSDLRGNTAFTPVEREQITRSLTAIEEFTAKNYQLTVAHQEHVREQLKYLSEAAERVGRFDWKNLAAATFIDLVLTLGLDPANSQKLLSFATQLLGHLVVGVARLLTP